MVESVDGNKADHVPQAHMMHFVASHILERKSWAAKQDLGLKAGVFAAVGQEDSGNNPVAELVGSLGYSCRKELEAGGYDGGLVSAF